MNCGSVALEQNKLGIRILTAAVVTTVFAQGICSNYYSFLHKSSNILCLLSAWRPLLCTLPITVSLTVQIPSEMHVKTMNTFS